MPNWKGISYPVAAGEQGFFNVDENDTLIRANILQIIGTYRGERVMLPKFGTRLRDFVHEPLVPATIQLIKVDLIDAIKRWEPRVKLIKTTVSENRELGLVEISLYYRLLNDPNERSLDVQVDRLGGVRA